MRALVVEKDGSLAIQEVAKPECSPRQALVRTIACGMCGTDLTIIKRCFKGFPLTSYPLILGHEGVGEVIEIGSDVKSYKVGDKVLLSFNEAGAGMGSAYGALSEYAIVNDLAAYPADEAPEAAYAQTVLPPDMDPVDAIMFVTYREVLSSIRYFGIKAEDTIVVYGCGTVGQTFIKFLSLMGCKDIVAVDIVEEKLKIAEECGARKSFKGDSVNVVAEVRKLYPNGVKHVLDAVGLLSLASEAMEMLEDRGNILCYGVLHKEQITIDFSKAPYNWNFICQQMPRKKEEAAAHDQVMKWLHEGKIVMKDFISDYFEFEESVEAYGKFLDNKLLKKGIIKF